MTYPMPYRATRLAAAGFALFAANAAHAVDWPGDMRNKAAAADTNHNDGFPSNKANAVSCGAQVEIRFRASSCDSASLRAR